MRYALKNLQSEPADFTFGVEFNFSIGAREVEQALEAENVQEWTFEDRWRGIGIRLGADRVSTLLATPVETVSESESGLEKTVQQLAVLFQSRWTLGGGQTQEQVIFLEAGVPADLSAVNGKKEASL